MNERLSVPSDQNAGSDTRYHTTSQFRRKSSSEDSSSASHSRRRPSSHNRQDFQFVAATEPEGRHGAAAKRLIRSHVRKQSSRREVSHNGAPRRKSSLSPSENEELDNVDTEAALLSDSGVIVKSPVLSDTAEVRDESDLDELFSHYNTVCRTLHPLSIAEKFKGGPANDVWFQMAAQDELVLHSMLSIVAAASDAIRPVTSARTDALTNTIHEQLIGRLGRETIKDTTIASVVCLAIIEANSGNYDKWAMHMNGLVRMVQQKGGVGSIEKTIHLKLFECDIAGAMDQLFQPRFMRSSLPIRYYEAFRLLLNSGSGADLHAVGMNTSLQEVFSNISILTTMLNQSHAARSGFTQQILEEAFVCVQYDLLESPIQTDLDYMYRTAAMLFVRTTTCPTLSISHASVQLSLLLQSFLENNVSYDARWVLWMSVLGAMRSVGTANYGWFLALARSTASQLKCDTWEIVRWNLQQILWINKIHDPIGFMVWDNMQKL